MPEYDESIEDILAAHYPKAHGILYVMTWCFVILLFVFVVACSGPRKMEKCVATDFVSGKCLTEKEFNEKYHYLRR